MAFYRRRLPHVSEVGIPTFVTWRLHGSLPPNRSFRSGTLTSGQAFAALDRLLDTASTGPFYLRQHAIAETVEEAIAYNATVLGHHTLHTYVVMPNHIHLLITPLVSLPKLTKSLKGITANRANAMLARTGSPFWQEESYDHQVRHPRELDRIRRYIEFNPARAGLVRDPREYRWSSARWPTRASAADQGARPTPA